jgi:hypothetical protein
MSSDNNRFQHLESEIEGLRKVVKRLESRMPANEPERSGQSKRWDHLNVGLMTLFTGLLFVSSMLQWSATRDAITDTHTSFEIGTRAWVLAKDAYVKPTKADAPNHAIVQEGTGLKGSHAPAVSVQLVNAGHSPALGTSQNSRIEVVASLPEDDFAMPPAAKDQLASKNVIAPDGTMAVNRAFLLSDSEYDDIFQGRRFLAAYGTVTYDDIFKRRHEMKFCYFYDHVTEKMSYCPHYNSAD